MSARCCAHNAIGHIKRLLWIVEIRPYKSKKVAPFSCAQLLVNDGIRTHALSN